MRAYRGILGPLPRFLSSEIVSPLFYHRQNRKACLEGTRQSGRDYWPWRRPTDSLHGIQLDRIDRRLAIRNDLH